MKLFRNLTLLLVGAFMASSLASCDEVKSDDRYIELPPVVMQRKVLLEEFTGQFCVNCPNAHAVIASLMEQYPENLIPVSIHSGGDAFSLSEDESDYEWGIVGLRNAEGEALYSYHNITALPSGVVDRNSGVQTMNQWASSIRAELEKPTAVGIELEAALSADKKEITVKTSLLSTEQFYGTLALWVVESGITALQTLENGDIDFDYVHNHVFRATVNSLNGTAVILAPYETEELTFTIPVKEFWNADNLSVVGFVYNRTGVVQAEETEVGGDQTPAIPEDL